ncbi:MAG: hypothetical protein NTV34_12095, partial [Proteobacteria bacterium]|nr:hypothetical protein [Pseudomonadota bacterium]
SLILSCFMSCKSLKTDVNSSLLDADPIDQGELKIVEQWTLPANELSGLALGSYKGSQDVLVGVVDEEFEVVILDTKYRKAKPSILKISRKSNNPRKKSTWEAVVYSGPETLVALGEYPAALDFIDTKSNEVTDTVSIDFDRMLADQNENSFAEGVVLLKDGHALLGIEKNPLALVEIGPKGDREFWKLPSKITKPEGFVVHKNTFYVVSDTSGDDPNLFLLKE